MIPMKAPPDYKSGRLVCQSMVFCNPEKDALDVQDDPDQEVDPNNLCGTISAYEKGMGTYHVYYFFDTEPALIEWFLTDKTDDEDSSQAVCVEGKWFLTEPGERISVTGDEQSYEETGIVTIINLLLLKKGDMPILLTRIENPSAI